MIQGIVTPQREAIISLGIQINQREIHEFEFVIDTGFSGFLTLPGSVIQNLGLSFQRRGRVILADGNESLFDIYDAITIWDEKKLKVSVDEVDSGFLVGMDLLYDYEMVVQIKEGGKVIISPLK